MGVLSPFWWWGHLTAAEDVATFMFPAIFPSLGLGFAKVAWLH